MADPKLVQENFLRMVRDQSRAQLGDNECHNLVDYIPKALGAPLTKRGGWSYYGPVLTDVDANADDLDKVVYAPFDGAEEVVGIDSDGRVYDLTNSVDRAGTIPPGGPPVFYRELLIIPGQGNGAPQKYNGSANAASLSGSPPLFNCCAVYKDRLVAGGADAATNRLYFSGPGNPESWDTTNRWMDTSGRIRGVAALRNAVLVFHRGKVERIRGDIPPGSAAANMTLEPLFDGVGVYGGTRPLHHSDAICVHDDTCYFADEGGVYATDGANFTDLTEMGGISSYWRTQMATVKSENLEGRVALGMFRNMLFCSLTDFESTGSTYVDFLVCELRTRSWFRLSNIAARHFGAQNDSIDELYFANQESKRAGKLSSIFEPASGTKNDADGDAVVPILETHMFYLGTKGKDRIRDLYLGYDLRDAASDNPTIAVSYLTSPEATSYTALSSVSESSEYSRVKVPVSRKCNQIGFKLAQSGASSDTRIHSIELFGHSLEGSRR